VLLGLDVVHLELGVEGGHSELCFLGGGRLELGLGWWLEVGQGLVCLEGRHVDGAGDAAAGVLAGCETSRSVCVRVHVGAVVRGHQLVSSFGRLQVCGLLHRRCGLAEVDEVLVTLPLWNLSPHLSPVDG